MNKYFLDFKSIPWESPMAGMRQKYIIRNDQKTRLLEFDEDFFEAEWCLKKHVGYVIEGRVTINFDDSKVVYEKGDGLFISGGETTRHKASVEKGEKVLFIMFEDV